MALGASLAGLASAGLGVASSRTSRKAQQQALRTKREDVKEAAFRADPFAPYRGQFVEKLLGLYGVAPKSKSERLKELEAKAYDPAGAVEATIAPSERIELRQLRAERAKDPEAFDAQQPQAPDAQGFLENLPGFQFALNQGIKAASRRAAASGMGLSGNLLTELQALGTGLASQAYGKEFERLGMLSGATSSSPAAAGSILAGQPAATPTIQKHAGVGSFLAEAGSLFDKFGGGTSKQQPATKYGNEAAWWSAGSQYI